MVIAVGVTGLSACAPMDEIGDAVPGVIPAPVSFDVRDGAEPFRLTESTRLVASGAGAAAVAETFAEVARAATGFTLPVVDVGPAASPRPAQDGADLSFVVARGEAPDGADEGYTLESSADGVRVASDTAAGLFRGSQTLRQLLPAEIERADAAGAPAGGWTVPAASVADAPRFAYRGAMLDIARHFFPVDDVLRFIDAIALLKLN
ncbi:MAG TPA: glycoside hydrolase family 20 zincin-like fold domain-containing protein, partial [Microbacterium sp.]|nr:glycoside hydrolase family 20 zincin-like fold domain-containing protein [Microbacterium sp.]